MINTKELNTLLQGRIPDSVANHPGMTSEEERKLLYGLAKDHFLGQGVIIDAGIFLGASSVAFGEGLFANERIERQSKSWIQSYDIAIWINDFKRYLESSEASGYVRDENLQTGDSFEAPLRKILSKYSSIQEFHIGDIVELAPGHDGPVEIAFYDCLKTYDRDLAAFSAFSPHYIQGRTIVLQQDYFYEAAPHNKVRQEYFMDHYDFLGEVKDTAVFLNKSPLPTFATEEDPVSDLSIEEQISLIERAARRTKLEHRRIKVRLAGLEHSVESLEFDHARHLALSIRSDIQSHGRAARSSRICGAFNRHATQINHEMPAKMHVKELPLGRPSIRSEIARRLKRVF